MPRRFLVAFTELLDGKDAFEINAFTGLPLRECGNLVRLCEEGFNIIDGSDEDDS